ncbi:hypothetical protein [Sphingobacterium sp. E70]
MRSANGVVLVTTKREKKENHSQL